MRTPAARVGIVVSALAAAVALFFALAGGNDGAATARSQTPPAAAGTQSVASSAATKPQSAPATTRSTAAKPATPRPKVGRIFVRDGRPAGGVRRFELKRGERVRFAVYSDAADEMHIHGFEITKAVPARRLVSFAFPADIEGVFEVELHEAHVQIAELRIRP
jgi:hypothetical protein